MVIEVAVYGELSTHLSNKHLLFLPHLGLQACHCLRMAQLGLFQTLILEPTFILKLPHQ